jgi:multiple sugar transport system substrate-binding protein
MNPPVVTVTKPTTSVVTTTVPTTSVVTTTVPTTSVVTKTTSVVTTTTVPTTTVIPYTPPFTFWTEKGYTESEDKAWDAIIKSFCDQYGIKGYEITRAAYSDLDIKLTSAIDAGTPPDCIQVPMWSEAMLGAFKGWLVDLSDLIEPVKDKLAPAALECAYLYDDTIKKRSYYNATWAMSGFFLHVNKDLIRKAGEDPNNIPKEWNEFHDFFKRVQKKLGGPPPYAFGYPVSTASMGDGPNMVQQLFNTMGGEAISKDNEFVMDHPENRAIFIETVEILSNFIKEGYCPKDALTWTAPGNNTAFNTGVTVTMWNGSLSIPMYWLGEDPRMYYEGIATIDAPKGPHGEEWKYLMWGGGLQTYKKSKNIELAKKFISYMLQPQQQITIIKGMGGRLFPAHKDAAEDPSLKNGFVTPDHPVDPNYPAFYRQLFQRKNTIPWDSKHIAFSDALAAGCWTDCFSRVIVDGWTPAEAVDEQIARMKTFWKKYGGA